MHVLYPDPPIRTKCGVCSTASRSQSNTLRWAPWHLESCMKRGSNENLSCNAFYYTTCALLVMSKNSCRQRHCQTDSVEFSFNVKSRKQDEVRGVLHRIQKPEQHAALGAVARRVRSCILHPTPCTLHSTPYTLHATPFTLHRTPYNLHPTPYTLHPTPYTLRPTD